MRLAVLMTVFVVVFQTLYLKNSNTQDLIEQLGSESYVIRERATKELIKSGHSALSQVKNTIDSTDDIEVKKRCEYIVQKYYSIIDGPLPSIWSLPSTHRFINNKDIAKAYYARAREEWNDVSGHIILDDDEWMHQKVMSNAMRLYLSDILSLDKKEEVLHVRNITTSLQKKLLKLVSQNEFFVTGYTCYKFYNDGTPIQIEELIEEWIEVTAKKKQYHI